jgi:hypothetical protein
MYAHALLRRHLDRVGEIAAGCIQKFPGRFTAIPCFCGERQALEPRRVVQLGLIALGFNPGQIELQRPFHFGAGITPVSSGSFGKFGEDLSAEQVRDNVFRIERARPVE